MSAIVALVGRPNVGKSTLFDRLVGRKEAIVHDEPGVTRNRRYGTATSRDRTYTLVDTAASIPTATTPSSVGVRSAGRWRGGRDHLHAEREPARRRCRARRDRAAPPHAGSR